MIIKTQNSKLKTIHKDSNLQNNVLQTQNIHKYLTALGTASNHPTGYNQTQKTTTEKGATKYSID